MALYDANNGSNAYGWTCDTTNTDTAQKWTYNSDTKQLQNEKGSCLALYNANNGSNAYGWTCDTTNTDTAQKWSF